LRDRRLFFVFGGIHAPFAAAAIEKARFATTSAIGTQSNQPVEDFFDEAGPERAPHQVAAAVRAEMPSIAGLISHSCAV
jgi:hypothetical protein